MMGEFHFNMFHLYVLFPQNGPYLDGRSTQRVKNSANSKTKWPQS